MKKNLKRYGKKGGEIRKRAVNPVALARTQGFNITNMLYYYYSKNMEANTGMGKYIFTIYLKKIKKQVERTRRPVAQ
jgi:hypothetical protein